MVWAFRLFTAAVLFAHGAVFLNTLGPAPEISIGETWLLHIATLITVGLMFVALLRQAWPERARAALWDAVPWTARVFTPVGAVILVSVFAAHSSGRPWEGVPTQRDGQLVLISHGRVVREITEEEARLIQIDQVRGTAEVGLIFTWIATSVLWALPTNRFDDQ